jgi:hypothetical protein
VSVATCKKLELGESVKLLVPTMLESMFEKSLEPQSIAGQDVGRVLIRIAGITDRVDGGVIAAKDIILNENEISNTSNNY